MHNFSLLLLIRFCTGLGMGGALPMMITLASEAVPDQHKGTAVSVMYSGIPLADYSLLLSPCRWQAMQSGVIFSILVGLHLFYSFH